MKSKKQSEIRNQKNKYQKKRNYLIIVEIWILLLDFRRRVEM